MKDFFGDLYPVATIVSIIVMALLVGCFFSEIARTIVVFGIIGLIILIIGAFVYESIVYLFEK